MITVNEATTAGPVNGRYDKRFESVAEEFVRNFEQRGEVGASVCINIEGETVVDMWGGMRDPETGDSWQEDTLSIVFSCTKAATALCAHMLIERGQLDPNAKVTDYWPEFGQNGKENTTVLMMLNHSAALPALRETVKPGGYNDWDYMVERLAAESPFWEPGTRNGYHMITYGWTVGELVRRVSGKSLGTFFKDEVASPLGIDFWIGLPEDKEPRVANMIPFAPDPSAIPTDFLKALVSDPDSIQYLSFLNSGGHQVDSREAHAAEIGGGGGVANGRALAGMFNPLANDGKSGSVELLSADTIKRISAVSMATQCDATLLIPTRFAQGFMVSMDNRARPTGDQETALLGRDAFGHVGAGGSIGFADPECRMGFGYTMTQMGAGLMLNERGQSVVNAAYKSVGYRTNAPGFWVR
jgi:CubicO group peptidase (beta-lactamase class C family)